MRQHMRIALLAWLCLSGSAALANVTNSQAAAQIAAFIQGKFIATVNGVFFVEEAKGAIDVNGQLSLQAEVDPLYEVSSTQGPYREDSSVDYWNLAIAADAKCGPSTLPTEINGTDLSVQVGGRFINLHEAIEGSVSNPPEFSASNRPLVLSEADFARARKCKDTVAARLNALPYESIQVFAGETMLTEVRRSLDKLTKYEFDLGADAQVTHVSVKPKAGGAHKFSVSVQTVSVMRCDYEGPHIELDEWKQGLSPAKSLRSKANTFFMDAPAAANGDDQVVYPPFPAYTQQELRKAINAYWGKKGLSTRAEAEPCGPFLRGYRFRINDGPSVVHEVNVYNPGGC